MAQRIYLDHAATTPMRPEAIAAVAEGMRRWANPSSPHAEGRAARAALEDARARIKAALGWDGELIFTSGASEALSIALGRANGGKRFVSAVEHDAVFRAAGSAERLPLDARWEVDQARLADALARAARPVVVIQHVNSETGAFQPIDAFTAMVRDVDGTMICDCAQSAGKFALPDTDIAIVSAHKLGGPPGIGALLVRDFGLLEPSGGQEFGYRGGTENLPGALGFAAALDVAGSLMPEGDVLDQLGDRLTEAVEALGGERLHRRIGHGSTLIEAVAMPGLSAQAQLIRFDMAGFSVSAGSACASGSLKPSHVLTAMGIDPDAAARTIRVSFGWTTTREDVERFVDAWIAMASEARERAA